MALVKLAKDGFGQLELNQVAFRRSGRIEAQCRIADGIEYIENGMLLAVNNVNRTVNYPTANGVYPIALHYSTEHMYDERTKGLKYFKLDKNTFLPRMGYLGAGDKYTTNTVCFDEALSYDTIKTNLEKGTVYYAAASTTEDFEGYHEITTDSAKAVALVIAATTMPDGQLAFKFQAL